MLFVKFLRIHRLLWIQCPTGYVRFFKVCALWQIGTLDVPRNDSAGLVLESLKIRAPGNTSGDWRRTLTIKKKCFIRLPPPSIFLKSERSRSKLKPEFAFASFALQSLWLKYSDIRMQRWIHGLRRKILIARSIEA